jgi:hypothetical protein
LFKNASNFKNLNTYNFGLGSKTKIRDFYFSQTASAEGSLYPENMNQNYVRKDIKKNQSKDYKINPKNYEKVKYTQKKLILSKLTLKEQRWMF